MACLYICVILPVLFYEIEMLHWIASRTGRKKDSICLKTKDVWYNLGM